MMYRNRFFFSSTLAIFILISCSKVSLKKRSGFVRQYTPIFGEPKTIKTAAGKSKAVLGQEFSGSISYYGPGFHGKKTASGAVYNQNDLTCAHKTLPFGTKVEVHFLKTNKSVILKVNDRGPYAHGRILDVSVAAAKKLGMMQYGHGKANIKIID